VAVGSAWSAQAMTSQQRARAEGMFCLLCDFVLASFFSSCLKNIVRLSSGIETTLNESVKNRKTLAQAAEQKEADRMAMSEAISAFRRTFGLDDVPSGSSPQSRLWALGGHVRSRLRGAPTKRRSPYPRSKGLTQLPRAQARHWLPSSRWRSFRLRRRPRPG
jgi:hypothetical protein